jgi:hypothetical protein
MQSSFETIEFLDSKEDQYFRHRNSIKSMTLTQLKDKTKNLTSEINIKVRFTEQSNEWGDYAPKGKSNTLLSGQIVDKKQINYLKFWSPHHKQ